MSALKHGVAAAGVIAIFCAGLMVGRGSIPSGAPGGAGNGAQTGVDVTARPPVEERWSGTTLEEYQRRLQLTPAQLAVIRPLFAETAQTMTRLRRELKADLQAAVKTMNERVSAELTVEQRREFVGLIREKQTQREAVK